MKYLWKVILCAFTGHKWSYGADLVGSRTYIIGWCSRCGLLKQIRRSSVTEDPK